jgi:Malectin domain
MREGIFTYNIPLKPHQTYEMRLYFSEPEYRYHNEAAGDGEAKRIFNVLANGNDLLDHFDIISDAGFASTTIRAFENVQPAQDGKLHLQFVADKSEPLLNAIELLPAAANTIPPIRIHAGRSYYTDHAGNQWGPDNFYIGGELYSVDVPITGTADSDIYKVERFGNFYYAIPVPPGHYSLTLYFAETWFHDPGRRVFDVSCNGVMLLHRFDIFQEAGYAHLIQRTFHGLEPNGQGKLLISFSPIVDHASVRALQVEDESH